MNKQLTFIVTAGVAGLGLVGVAVMMVVKPEAADDLAGYLFQLIPILGAFGGLAAMQHQQGKEIETIKHNTNGTLSKRDEDIVTLRAKLAEVDPEALAEVDATTGAVRTQSAESPQNPNNSPSPA